MLIWNCPLKKTSIAWSLSLHSRSSKYRVFLDTNVIFSALYNPSGLCGDLVFLTPANLELVSSSYVHAELMRLIKKRYPSLEKRIADLKTISFWELPDFYERDAPIKPKDLPVLRGAQYMSCDYLVTGDMRDFHSLIRPSFSVLTRIISVKDLFKFLDK